MSFAQKLILVSVAVQFLFGMSSGYVDLEMWEKGCKGGWYRNDIINNNVCFSWPSAGGGSRGVQMRYGSCLAVYTRTGCSNSNGYLTETGRCYVAHIYSARTCVQRDVDVRCSPGTVLKSLAVSSEGPNGGLSISCYDPAAAAFPISLETHSLNSTNKFINPIATTCEAGIGGLVNEIDEVRGVVTATSAVCEKQCPEGEVVVGITAKIEEYTELIKDLNVLCTSVA